MRTRNLQHVILYSSYFFVSRSSIELTIHDSFYLIPSLSYSLMLRVYKTYEFNFQNPEIQARVVSFSARPGDLESKDDFYVTDSNLVVMETSFNTYNVTNWAFLHMNSVPVWLRAQVATRLARNASHWTQVFAKFRSGTHNSQWIAVDHKQFEAQRNNSNQSLKNIGKARVRCIFKEAP